MCAEGIWNIQKIFQVCTYTLLENEIILRIPLQSYAHQYKSNAKGLQSPALAVDLFAIKRDRASLFNVQSGQWEIRNSLSCKPTLSQRSEFNRLGPEAGH